MLVREVIQILENKYPLDLQEEWDKSGFQLGNKNNEVNKIMIALDCDLRTINEAIDNNVDLLITHHPLLFKSVNLDEETPMGEMIFKAIKNNLSIYSSHTPLDKVSMNKWLIEALGITNASMKDEFVASGSLNEPLSQKEFLALVKKTYNLESIKYAGNKDTIQTVSIVGGSGSEFIDDSDAFLSGDFKYHLGENAYYGDTLYVDIGHHAEVIMVSKLKEELENEIDIEIIESRSPDYYHYG